MSDEITALLLAVGIGVMAWFVLTPLVSSIPYALDRSRQREAMYYANDYPNNRAPQRESVERQFKALICLAAAAIGAMVLQVRGVSYTSCVLLVYLLGSLLLAAINWRTSLLPDTVVLPLLWAGLLYSAWAGDCANHVYAASLGYGVPLLLTGAIQLKTGKQMMGYGDMKAFAMAGAWFGVEALPIIFVGFCFSLLFVALGIRLIKKVSQPGYVPTGVGHLVGSLAWALGVQFV